MRESVLRTGAKIHLKQELQRGRSPGRNRPTSTSKTTANNVTSVSYLVNRHAPHLNTPYKMAHLARTQNLALYIGVSGVQKFVPLVQKKKECRSFVPSIRSTTCMVFGIPDINFYVPYKCNNTNRKYAYKHL